MKKLTLNKINFVGAAELTREQLKKVMGGSPGSTETTEEETTMGRLAPCDDWAKAEKSTCYNCCITVHDLDWCATKCGF